MSTILVLFLLLEISVIYSLNSPIEDNELGITARACAAKFCEEKDSLELWLAVEYQCYGQYLLDPLVEPSERRRILSTSRNLSSPKGKVSRVGLGVICAVSSLFGLATGYYFSRSIKKSKNQIYTLIPTSDVPDSHYDDKYDDIPVGVAYSVADKKQQISEKATYH